MANLCRVRLPRLHVGRIREPRQKRSTDQQRRTEADGRMPSAMPHLFHRVRARMHNLEVQLGRRQFMQIDIKAMVAFALTPLPTLGSCHASPSQASHSRQSSSSNRALTPLARKPYPQSSSALFYHSDSRGVYRLLLMGDRVEQGFITQLAGK